MTYHEVAQELIQLYNSYVEICTANEEGYNNYNEAVVIAIESLLIRANQEKVEAMQRETISAMSTNVAPTFNSAILELEDAFDKHFKMGDI